MSKRKLPPGLKREPMNTFAMQMILQERLKTVAKLLGDDSANDLLEEAALMVLEKYDRFWCVEQARQRVSESQKDLDDLIKALDKESSSRLTICNELCIQYLRKRDNAPASVPDADSFIRHELVPKTGLTFDGAKNILEEVVGELKEKKFSEIMESVKAKEAS